MIFYLAGSVPSLAMGLACGSLMMAGAYQTSNDAKNIALSLGMCFPWIKTELMSYLFESFPFGHQSITSTEKSLVK